MQASYAVALTEIPLVAAVESPSESTALPETFQASKSPLTGGLRELHVQAIQRETPVREVSRLEWIANVRLATHKIMKYQKCTLKVSTLAQELSSIGVAECVPAKMEELRVAGSGRGIGRQNRRAMDVSLGRNLGEVPSANLRFREGNDARSHVDSP